MKRVILIVILLEHVSFVIASHYLLDNLEERKNIVSHITPYYSANVSNVVRCKKLCQYQDLCSIATYSVKKRTCFLYDKRSLTSKVKIDPGWILFNNSQSQEPNLRSCAGKENSCLMDFNFKTPDKCLSINIHGKLNPRDCCEVLLAGGTTSGIYTVFPREGKEGISVFCDQETDGGGWLKIRKGYRKAMERGILIVILLEHVSLVIASHYLLDNLEERKNIVSHINQYYIANVSNVVRCKKLCQYQELCSIATYSVKKRECHLYDKRSLTSKVKIDPGWILFNNSQSQEPNLRSCAGKENSCLMDFNFKTPDKCLSINIHGKLNPRDCCEVLLAGGTTSGIYTVFPRGGKEGISVFCDQETDGGGWLLFQRRMDGSENFLRNWTDYKNGFGNLEREFWLGNRFISDISTSRHYQLRVDLEDFESETRYATYNTFAVSNGSTNFTLSIAGFNGTAGDGLTYHNGQVFSTTDRDNTTPKCVNRYKGCFWYKTCMTANVNGLYLRGPTNIYAEGVTWGDWRGWYYSLKRTELKIRPYSHT